MWHVKIIFHAIPACHGKPVLGNQLLNGGDSLSPSLDFILFQFLSKGGQEIEFQEIKTGDQKFFFPPDHGCFQEIESLNNKKTFDLLKKIDQFFETFDLMKNVTFDLLKFDLMIIPLLITDAPSFSLFVSLFLLN